jgi:hypothetical protein
MFSWIIQHIIGSIPSWVWIGIALIGFICHLVVWIAGHFPMFKSLIKLYSPIIKLVGYLLIVFGVFMFGGEGVTAIWKEQIKEQEEKIATAESASKAANAQLNKVRKQKNKVIYQRQVVIHERIKNIETKIDTECKVDPLAIQVHNDAAKNPEKKQ